MTRATDLSLHVTDVVSMLEAEDLRDVVLVGHSYGGAVVTGVADRARDRVSKLVYIDGVALEDGQSVSGAADTEAALASMAEGDSWLLPPLPLAALGVVTKEDVAWVEPRRHAHPMRTLHERLSLTKGTHRAMPTTFALCGRRQALVDLFGADPHAPYVARGKRLGWRVETLDAPHAAMVAEPAHVADLLLSHA